MASGGTKKKGVDDECKGRGSSAAIKLHLHGNKSIINVFRIKVRDMGEITYNL